MALKVVSMEELKLEVLLEPERTGESVAEVCARHGISRASYYRYRMADRRHPGPARRWRGRLDRRLPGRPRPLPPRSDRLREPERGAAWACFLAASSAYGLPRQLLLSDNHSSFTGRLLGITVEFERRLAEAGVELINAAPAHPQTLGKLERFHRTLKEWLSDEGPAADLEHLQLLLDRFRSHYNQERPHQGIGNLTPAERYLPAPAPAARLREPELAEYETPLYPPYSITRNVWDDGVVGYQRLAINVEPPLPRRHCTPPRSR